jgi:hypothetical protein
MKVEEGVGQNAMVGGEEVCTSNLNGHFLGPLVIYGYFGLEFINSKLFLACI